MKPILSPRDLADAIGVSESSIKRWVDDGVIRATRTAGGHRRIPVAEAIRFVRESESVLLQPQVLGLGDVASLGGDYPAYGEEADRLFELLRAGAAEEAKGLLVALYLSGRSVAQLVDGPLRMAMERIGELWVEERRAIAWEHRATDIAIQALNRLRSILPRPATPVVAVGGAPSGDRYIIPSLAVATVLTGEGLEAVNLGPETPLETLRLSAEELDARLVWLSVSVVESADGLSRQIRELQEATARRSVPLVIGGSRLAELDLPRSDLVYAGSSMAELEALVRGLRLAASRVASL